MSTFQGTMSVLSGLLALTGYARYILAILRGHTRPAKTTWIIWATLDVIALSGMYVKNALNGQIAAVTLGAVIVASLALRYGTPGWTRVDKFCLMGAVIGIGVWPIFHSPVLAIMTSLSVIFIGSIPTFVATWRDPTKEDRTAWTIYWLSCVLALVAIPAWNLADAAQPIVFFMVSATMMYLLYGRALPHSPSEIIHDSPNLPFTSHRE